MSSGARCRSATPSACIHAGSLQSLGHAPAAVLRLFPSLEQRIVVFWRLAKRRALSAKSRSADLTDGYPEAALLRAQPASPRWRWVAILVRRVGHVNKEVEFT